ncbi:MAG: carbohydrate ABC transporter permease, partial [Caldilineaceae bacterium]|nr:carbohydrate ABC transporter permease [Caldilineaceae bacterium]
EGQMVDPANPGEIIKVNINDREELREVRLAWENYTEPLQRFNFLIYLRNSVVVTVAATIITLLINSMA